MAVAHDQRDGVRAQGRERMRRVGARRGGTVAEVPLVGERIAVRVRGGGAVEGDRLIAHGRVGSARIRGRRLVGDRDRRRGRRGGVVAVAHDQRDRVRAQGRERMRRAGARRRRAVAEVPLIGQRIAVRVGRAGAVEGDRLIAHGRVRPTRIRGWDLIRDRDRGRGRRGVVVAIVHDHRDRVGAQRRECMRRVAPRARGTVPEVPLIGQHIVVRVGRAGAVERDRLVAHGRIGPACIGGGCLVRDRDGRRGRGGSVVAVDHDQRDRVRAQGREGVRRVCARARWLRRRSPTGR